MDEAYRKKERIIEERASLLSDREEEIDRTLRNISRGSVVRVVFYRNGKYVSAIGRVQGVLSGKRVIVMDVPISFDDVYDLEIIVDKV